MSTHESESGVPPTIAEIADLVGGTLRGNADFTVRGIASVEEAGPEDVAFFAAKRYAKYVPGSRAGAFLTSEEMEGFIPDALPRVVVKEPHRALIDVIRRVYPEERPPATVHPTAVLGNDVRLGQNVGIGPYAVLEDGVEVGDGSRIGPHVVLGRNAKVGENCTLHAQVVLYPNTSVGDRVILHTGTCLGADGFGYSFFDGAHHRIPHVGRCIVGDDVEIGVNSAVDRGSIGDTVIEQGAKIDNLVQVGHNVKMGALSMVAGMAGIAGSTRIGKGVWMGGQVGIINHLEIGDGARLAVAAKVMRDVPAGETMSGHPARPHREDMRRQAQVARVPKLLDRIAALEAVVEELRGSAD